MDSILYHPPSKTKTDRVYTVWNIADRHGKDIRSSGRSCISN